MAHSDANKPFERLPQNVKPILYHIALQTDLNHYSFTGIEIVRVEVVSPTKEIILNSVDLDIKCAFFVPAKDGPEINGTISYEKEEEEEQVILTFNETINPGKGYLKLVFVGLLNNRMVGFYRARYRSPVTRDDVYAAATQFELTNARRAFPCWDEPAIKARFNITIIAPKNRVVVSNTNIINEEPYPKNPKLKIVTFDTTPLMSTYLVAFVVGEYDVLESATERGTKMRVYTQVGAKANGIFALTDAIKYVNYYEKYFKIDYPLSKLDHISIPGFAFGTMGNWGLVTYRDVKLYIDKEKSSFLARMSVAQAIAHETASQWFGALVSMEWWTHFWLFESFAIFMRYLAVEAHHPEFEIYKQFAIATSISALELDASHESHPVETPIGSPAEISTTFDEVSYDKGASIIKMCHNWIGDKAFRAGMQEFFTTHAYKNVCTEDLWKTLEKASNKPVRKIMQTWTSQMGFPLITVSIASTSDTTVVINLKQEKFCIDGEMSESESEMLWDIPISLVTSDKPGKVIHFGLLSERAIYITLYSFSLKNGWFKLNPSLYGFYRVNYPVELWNSLGQAVRNRTMESLDRLHLLDDMLALNMAGVIPVVRLLKMLENYDDDHVNWNVVDKCLSQLGVLISYTDSFASFQAFGRRMVSQFYEKLGFDEKPDDSDATKIMRTLVISRLILLNDQRVIEEAKRRFITLMTGNHLAPSLRHPVYLGVVKSGDDHLYEVLRQLCNGIDMHSEKVTIATALGATLDDANIEQTLQFSLSNHLVSQDGWQIIVATSGTPKGRIAAWRFYERNFRDIRNRYGSYEVSVVQNICENFASEEMAQKITDFFERHDFPDLEKTVKRAVEKIRVNAAWVKREARPLREYFAEHISFDNLCIRN